MRAESAGIPSRSLDMPTFSRITHVDRNIIPSKVTVDMRFKRASVAELNPCTPFSK